MKRVGMHVIGRNGNLACGEENKEMVAEMVILCWNNGNQEGE